MEMMMGGLIGGGLGFAGQMINAEEQAETRDMNWATNIMNWQQRNKEYEQQLALALRARAEQKMGSTDIRGTRTKFVPGQGWVTTAGPQVAKLMAAQDAEQMKRLGHDANARRMMQDRNIARSYGDEALADTFRRQLVNTAPPKDDDAWAAKLMAPQVAALRIAGEDADKSAWRQAFRTGQNSNFDRIASGMQREKNNAYQQAAMQSQIMARGLGVKEQTERKNNLANLYNMFATRAGAVPDVSVNFQDFDKLGTLDKSMQGSLAADQFAASSAGRKGGELDYMSPLTGTGNAVSGLGSSLGSMFRGMAAKNAYQGNQGGGVRGFGSTRGDDGGGWSSGGSDIYLDTQGGTGGW